MVQYATRQHTLTVQNGTVELEGRTYYVQQSRTAYDGSLDGLTLVFDQEIKHDPSGEWNTKYLRISPANIPGTFATVEQWMAWGAWVASETPSGAKIKSHQTVYIVEIDGVVHGVFQTFESALDALDAKLRDLHEVERYADYVLLTGVCSYDYDRHVRVYEVGMNEWRALSW